MKIAISINTSWNIYNFRKGLIRFLQAQGHEVMAVAPEDDYSERLEKELGCTFHAVQMDNKGANPVKDFALYRQYVRLFKRLQPDVVLQFTIKPNIYGTLAARTAGIPVINNVSGLGTIFINRNTLASRAGRWLYKRAFRFPHKVFFQNDDDRQLFLNEKLVKKEITGLLPGSGVDLEAFPFTPKKLGNETVFLMISRVLYDKGVMEYAGAAKAVLEQHSDAKFILVGVHDYSAGSLSENDMRYISTCGVEYRGSTDDVLSEIKKADCVVLPSYREGTPKTLLEALSVGRPIITTNVPGCKETVSEAENGFLCDVKSVDSLAQRMHDFLSLTEVEREEMGRKGREMAERKFDQQIVFEQYKNVINGI